MISGRNEGGKEGRTGLHRKVTQVKYSACIFSIRKRNAERLLHPPLLPSLPPFPEAVLHSGGGGDGGSLPFPSPLGLPPLHRTHVLSLAHLFALYPLYL